MNFLDVLRMELENMDEENLHAPSEPFSKGEEPVAVLEDTVLKKLYSLAVSYEDQIMSLLVCEKNTPEVIANVRVLNRKAECMKNIFWISLYDKFNIPCDKAYLGIRIGWVVVKNACPQPAIEEGFFIKIPSFRTE